ncbi:MAG: polyprenyl synthetase family protein [Candidatus Bilamarchaeum sp.]
MNIPPHIKPYLDQLEDRMQYILSKEDQRVYGLLAPFIRRGGKRIRPLLCMVCCSAFGADPKSVLDPSVIIELFHNFTLIHDDIEDDSLFRRGEPTLHVSHGLAMALNSGDALYTFLLRELIYLKLPKYDVSILQKMYLDAFKRVVDGQGIEISWIRDGRFDISEDEYLHMINGKTSALMGLSCQAGAYIAGADTKTQNSLREFGEKIGLAFQIQDDVLNLIGDFEKYKKEIGGDISEGKRTLIVVHFFKKATKSEKTKLISILSSKTKDKKTIAEAIDLLKKYDSISYAKEYSRSLVEDAKSSLLIMPKSKDRDTLLELAKYVLDREA